MTQNLRIAPIHPFPARMAPEIALAFVDTLPANSLIVDPMMGSGTVIRTALQAGHHAVGVDIDPLAVLITKVWSTPLDVDQFRRAARSLVFQAIDTRLDEVHLPWIDEDSETDAFVNFWFALRQRNSLRKLCSLLIGRRGPIANALRLCISKMIVTKCRGASLAHDVSHSRPHKVLEENDYGVLNEFLKVADRLAKRLVEPKEEWSAILKHGNARNLNLLDNNSADAVITSPPYLNAIDYMRGHRLALVWLGYKLSDLRDLKRGAVGTERSQFPESKTSSASELVSKAGKLSGLPPRFHKMVMKYALDMNGVLAETHRILKHNGKAVFVVGDSRLRGVFVRNTEIIKRCAVEHGLKLVSSRRRTILSSRRYLPPPSSTAKSGISGRMLEEVVLTFTKPPRGSRTKQ